MTVSSDVSKAALRDQFRSYRQSLSPLTHAERSRRIAQRVLSLPEVRTAETVHAYWPMLARHEVDTRPIIDALHQSGVRIVLPVVTTFPPQPPELEHRLYEGRTALCCNRWGIAEPSSDAPTVSPSSLDLVLVPALGVGRNGHRVGNGAGYYDAFLAPLASAGAPIPRVVLAYDATFVNHVPASSHDVPATHIVTESLVMQP